MNDEFFIGYEPQMPAGLARRARVAAVVLVFVALLLSVTVVLTQQRSSPAVFEFGHARTLAGHIIEFPYPALSVVTNTGEARTYWLVGQGKHGAAELVRGRDGRGVELVGSLIQRDGDAMIEVSPDAIKTIDDSRPAAVEPVRSLGQVVVRGEIVDSKCHLGVMKPGEGPTHRDCAVRCLLGDIPPMLVPHDHAELGRLSLVSPDGRPFARGTDLSAGRPVSVRGELLQRGTQRFLAASPADIQADPGRSM